MLVLDVPDLVQNLSVTVHYDAYHLVPERKCIRFADNALSLGCQDIA